MRHVTAIACLSLCLPAAARDVWVVDASGGGDFLAPQAAVNAASQRDTVLIKGGTYPGFTVSNKGIQIVAENGASVLIDGLVTVRGLPEGRDTVLAGISGRFVLGSGSGGPTGGGVLLQGCRSWVPQGAHYWDHPLLVESSIEIVAVVHGTFIGEDHSQDINTGHMGGHGLYKAASDFTRILAYHTSFAGGGGSPGYSLFCFDGGDGGDGVRVNGGHLIVEGVTAFAGLGGGGCPPGMDGVEFDISAPGTMTASQTDGSKLVIPNLRREGEAFDVVFEGTPGTTVALIVADELQARDFGPSIGVLVPQAPYGVVPLGVVPADGTLVVPMTAPPLAPGEETRRWIYQGLVMQPGSRYLSNPAALVVIDASY